jgi:hypothetical protein
MLILGDLFLEYVKEYRSVWITGRLGGGKTSLAAYIAHTLAKEGYKIISNIRIQGAIRTPQPEDFSRAVVVLDEAADFLDAYEFRNELLASFKYLRHFDLICLFPCADKIHSRLRKLIVERVFRIEALLPLPLPIWIYRFWIGPGSFSRSTSIYSYFAFIPTPALFNLYDSTHGGRGVTTLHVLKAMREAIVVPSENILTKELVLASEDIQYGAVER